MIDVEIIDLTPDNIAEYGVCGYKDVKKHLELRRKIEWFREYYAKGLRIKALVSKQGGYQGMLEYLPGKYAHRPVEADGYMFIHCIFVGFKKKFKGAHEDVKYRIQWNIDNKRNKNLALEIKGSNIKTYFGNIEDYDIVINSDYELLQKVINGNITIQRAFMTGDIKAKGDFTILYKLDAMFDL